MIEYAIRSIKILLANKNAETNMLKIFIIASLIIIALIGLVMCMTISPPQPLHKP